MELPEMDVRTCVPLGGKVTPDLIIQGDNRQRLMDGTDEQHHDARDENTVHAQGRPHGQPPELDVATP
eukprot:7290340-Alexandrium_andersonii.AAC.1